SSSLPVAPISDTSSPQRMGSALTYARRYALFTLVGIAGEDDLDAPDLTPSAGPSPGSSVYPKPSPAASRPLKSFAARPRAERPKPANLAPDAATKLRDQLIAELEQ